MLENFYFSGGGLWLGLTIILEAMVIYGAVHLIKYLLRTEPAERVQTQIFDDAFESDNLI